MRWNAAWSFTGVTDRFSSLLWPHGRPGVKPNLFSPPNISVHRCCFQTRIRQVLAWTCRVVCQFSDSPCNTLALKERPNQDIGHPNNAIKGHKYHKLQRRWQ